jgi:hypothetical protein
LDKISVIKVIMHSLSKKIKMEFSTFLSAFLTLQSQDNKTTFFTK